MKSTRLANIVCSMLNDYSRWQGSLPPDEAEQSRKEIKAVQRAVRIELLREDNSLISELSNEILKEAGVK